jgi:glycosyltransferase involved in cell wall biosynthesis
MAPRVTVGVPVFNGERFLASTLDSLLEQTFTDFQIIVSDNASTDRTSEIAQEYSRRDPRVRVVSSAQNRGAARNYNHVFRMADTEYFRWSPADDLSDPGYLEAGIEVLDRHSDVVLAYGKTLLIDEEGAVISEYDDRLNLTEDRPSDRFVHFVENIGLCNAMYGLMRTEVVRRVRPMGSYVGSDLPWQAELSLHGKFFEIPQRLFRRRLHPAASKNLTHEDRVRFYNPEAPRSIALRLCRQTWGYAVAMSRAPLPAAQRLRLYRFLARRMIAHRDQLLMELIRAGRASLTPGSVGG